MPVLAVLFAAEPALAADTGAFAVRYTSTGDPDLSFNWQVSNSAGTDETLATFRDTTGKYVSCGFAQVNGQPQLIASRLLANGAPDTSFGWLGITTASTNGFASKGRGCAQPPDQLVYYVATDGGGVDSSSHSLAVTSFQPDGSLSTGWGNEGWASLDFPFESGYPVGIVATTTRVYVAAELVESTEGPFISSAMGIGAFTLGGEPDPSFGDNGLVFYSPSDVDGQCHAHGMVLDGNRPIVAGTCKTQQSNFNMAAVRFSNTGGPGGFTFAAPPSNSGSTANAIARTSSGKIVIVGSLDGQLAVTQRKNDGTADPNFNGGQLKKVAVGGTTSSYAMSVVIGPLNTIVIGGGAGTANGGRFLIARFLSTGFLDGTFAPQALTPGTVVSAPFTPEAHGNGVVLDPSGRPMLVGGAFH